MLQRHHHGLLDEVAFDEAPEVLPVDGEVRELEGADGCVQERLGAAAAHPRAGDVRARQRHDGGARVRDAPGEALLSGCQSTCVRGTQTTLQHV